MDGLALAEEEGMLLAVGLLRRKPLQRRRVGGRRVGDPHLGRPGRQLQSQPPPQHGIVLTQLEGHRHAVLGAHRVDRQTLAVQVHGAAPGLLELQDHLPIENLLFKVHP